MNACQHSKHFIHGCFYLYNIGLASYTYVRSLTTYLYLVPGSSPVKVKISLPSKIMAFSQGTSFPLGFVKTFSWTYIKLPPVMPGN